MGFDGRIVFGRRRFADRRLGAGRQNAGKPAKKPEKGAKCMTGVNAMTSGIQGMAGREFSSGGGSRLEALERKLSQLREEKEEAVRNKDKEKARKLEQEIQKIEKQIEQLKRKEKEKERQGGPKSENGEEAGYGGRPMRLGTGDRIDVYG